MRIAFGAIEVLLFVVLLVGLYWVFCKALNSLKVAKSIKQITDPKPETDDELAAGYKRAADAVETRVVDNDAEIERKREKNERLRKLYGG